MKKLLGLFILGLLVSSAAFARSTVCYKIAQGQITEEKDFVSYNYVCIEKLEGMNIAVKVYDGHKAGGKTNPDVVYEDCVDAGSIPFLDYKPKSESIKVNTATTLTSPKIILCSKGFYIAYEEPTETKPLVNFILDGNLYTITTTNFVLPLIHPVTEK
jgi:hypothetical protein